MFPNQAQAEGTDRLASVVLRRLTVAVLGALLLCAPVVYPDLQAAPKTERRPSLKRPAARGGNTRARAQARRAKTRATKTKRPAASPSSRRPARPRRPAALTRPAPPARPAASVGHLHSAEKIKTLPANQTGTSAQPRAPQTNAWKQFVSLGTLALALFAVVGGVLHRRGVRLFGHTRHSAPNGKASPAPTTTMSPDDATALRPDTRVLRSEAEILRSCLRAEKQFYLLPNRPELSGTLAAHIGERLPEAARRIPGAPARLEGALRTLFDYAIRRGGGAGADFALSERTLAVQITGSGGLWKEYVERKLPANLLDRLDEAVREFDETIRDERGNRFLLIRTL